MTQCLPLKKSINIMEDRNRIVIIIKNNACNYEPPPTDGDTPDTEDSVCSHYHVWRGELKFERAY